MPVLHPDEEVSKENEWGPLWMMASAHHCSDLPIKVIKGRSQNQHCCQRVDFYSFENFQANEWSVGISMSREKGKKESVRVSTAHNNKNGTSHLASKRVLGSQVRVHPEHRGGRKVSFLRGTQPGPPRYGEDDDNDDNC